MSEFAGKVTGLNLYPIKSCQAATVNGDRPKALDVGKAGLQSFGVADRDFVLAEIAAENPAHFVTQRGWSQYNRIDRANPRKDDHKLAVVRTNITSDSLQISGPVGFGSIEIDSAYHDHGAKADVNIFNKLLPNAIDQGDDAAEFFSTFLSRSLRLVRANRSTPRQVSEHNRRPGATNVTAAADSLPMLLANQSSLDFSHITNSFELGSVAIGQYRANVEIDGLPERPYDEDYWRKITIGEMTAFVVKACMRCPIPNNNQQTGERGAGGLAVLRGRLGFIDDPSDKAAVFGQNLNHVYAPGQTVNVGGEVRILERSDSANFIAA